MKKFFLIVPIIALSTFSKTNGQTLRLKSSSEKLLKVTFVGVNKEGVQVTKSLDEVDKGYWKTVNVNKVKYGFDMFHNKEMAKEGYDASNRWKQIIVEEVNNGKKDVFDVSKSNEGTTLPNTHIFIKVKKYVERDYVCQYVNIFDSAE